MYTNDLEYVSNLRIPKESKNISDSDLEVSINHPDKLEEDFKIHFGYLDNMQVPKWFVTPFGMKIDNKGYESDLEEKFIEIHVDLKANA